MLLHASRKEVPQEIILGMEPVYLGHQNPFQKWSRPATGPDTRVQAPMTGLQGPGVIVSGAAWQGKAVAL